ncbi:fructosamine kinase family protein [Uliginosibacterium sp. sgz301328]|uniref:fructosamine kinase family protein n=1 Tax=Uliginosibacterium sp. sgz301328 TaxID=3243764 RepID=UPI00359E0731
MNAALSAAVERMASDAIGGRFGLSSIEPVAGGDINTALRARGAAADAFVKLRPGADLAMFEAEARDLAALAACEAFRVPRVLGCEAVGDDAVLVLEWLDLRPLRGDAEGERAGHALAALHRLPTETHFGWPYPNFIGTTPQPNNRHDNWPRFFTLERLAPQLARAAANGYHGALQRDGERLCERAAALFLDYQPAPSLLHGDLWSGNIGMLEDGTPALFDPAAYIGDREADLAMTELFGGFPMSFYVAYRQSWPLHEGYEVRKGLYNLYHVLNHLNLFGRGYLAQAERMASRLATELAR